MYSMIAVLLVPARSLIGSGCNTFIDGVSINLLLKSRASRRISQSMGLEQYRGSIIGLVKGEADLMRTWPRENVCIAETESCPKLVFRIS